MKDKWVCVGGSQVWLRFIWRSLFTSSFLYLYQVFSLFSPFSMFFFSAWFFLILFSFYIWLVFLSAFEPMLRLEFSGFMFSKKIPKQKVPCCCLSLACLDFFLLCNLLFHVCSLEPMLRLKFSRFILSKKIPPQKMLCTRGELPDILRRIYHLNFLKHKGGSKDI